MDANQNKSMTSFRKTWDVLSPAVYYYLVYYIALILFAFIISLFVNAGGGEMPSWMENSKSMNEIIGGIAKFIGIVPLLPMLKSQLYANKVLYQTEKAKLSSYLITCVISFCTSVGINIFISLSGFIESSASYTEVADRQYGVAFGIGLLLYGIVAPLVEEVVFRGMVYNRMKKYYSVRISIVVSALLFGALHGNLVQALYGTCMGILLAYTYEEFKDFKIPCIFHAVANISVYTITYNSGLYEIIVRPYIAVVLLLVAAGLIWLNSGYLGRVR